MKLNVWGLTWMSFGAGGVRLGCLWLEQCLGLEWPVPAAREIPGIPGGNSSPGFHARIASVTRVTEKRPAWQSSARQLTVCMTRRDDSLFRRRPRCHSWRHSQPAFWWYAGVKSAFANSLSSQRHSESYDVTWRTLHRLHAINSERIGWAKKTARPSFSLWWC